MDFSTFLLFSASVIPLVCSPGPDILFVASQAISAGTAAGFRAIVGILLGYCVHSLLVAVGLAAVVAASPMLFGVIRWVGIAYLVYLAYKLVRAALRPGGFATPEEHVRNQLYKGFLTSLLNPKGMMVYLAILPQFMDRQAGNTTLQAVILSAAFIFWCAVVYSGICVAMGRAGGASLSDARRRLMDGAAGGMILVAAGFMALGR
ncbi:MAG TPA: LysE family translocator [Bordetella sp.]|jgi:threonine/homoserine/homoserine lactone efflux protein|nr:LysE family translocator [Bordetella sp.]